MSAPRKPKFLGMPTIYVASAGTGKTHRIIEDLYVALETIGFENAHKLLAITFTENAASEMRERIQAKLLSSRGMKALPLAQELNISTIHSFCRREMARHAVRLGLDPAFEVLVEAPARKLARHVLLGILRERFNSAEKREKSALARSLRFNSYFRSTGGFGRSLEYEMLQLYLQLRSRGILAFTPELFLVAQPSWGNASDKLGSQLVRIDEAPANYVRTKGSQEKLSRVQEFIRTNKKELSSLKPVERTVWLLRDLAGTIDLRGTDELKVLLKPLKEELIPDCIAAVIAQDSQAIRDEVAAILSELDVRLNAEKRAARALDFEDLQLTMLRALENDADLRDYYRRRFSTVFVDEFQDTNPLQVKIVELMAEERAHYFVGDPKQSIFGWRFAEPETIRQKQRRFSTRGLADKLTRNWRSRPEILSFVNRLFGGADATLGFEYDDLNPAGEVDEKCAFRYKDHPSIDVIVRPEAEDGFSLAGDERRGLEAEAVAGYIHEAVENRTLTHTRADETPRPLEYGDFAILLRKNSYVPAYEAALSAANIPFVSETSVGFLETPEISALCDLLKLLLTPENDLLLAQVLRSDFVGLSASGLAELAMARKAEREEDDEAAPLIKLLEKGVAFSDADDAAAVEEFAAWLAEALRRISTLSAAELVRFMVDGLRLREKLIARVAPARSLMNLNRFADMAHGAEGLGYAALGKLVEQVRELRYQASQIGEMWMEGTGFVRIMTVHRAKGLTIPAVVLPDVDYGKPTFSPALSVEPSDDEPGRYELGISHRLADDKGREPWHEHHKELRKARGAEEEARLLYVALTRAVEHIAIFGVSANPRRDKPWAQHLRSLISEDGSPGAGFADLISVRPTPAQAESEGATEETPTLDELALLVSAVTADADGSKARASELMREASVTPDTSGYHRYLYGVSEFLEYVRTGTIGRSTGFDDEIADHDRIDGHKTADEAGGEDARELGTALHDLLAFAVAQPNALRGGDITPLLDEKFIGAHFPQHSGVMARQKERAAHLLRGYEALGLAERCTGAKAVRPEYAFLLKAESVFLRGRIDLLLADDTALTVLDYKTDRTDGGKRKSGLLEHYRPQLLVYSLAAQAIYPGRQLKAGLALLDCCEIVWLDGLDEGLADIQNRIAEFASAAATDGGNDGQPLHGRAEPNITGRAVFRSRD